MKRNLKIVITAGSIIFILLTGVILSWRAYVFLKYYRIYSVDKNPYLYIIPEYRNIANSKTPSVNSELTYDGLKISTPWGKPLDGKIIGSYMIFTFQNNKKIMLDEKFKESFVDTLNGNVKYKFEDNLELKKIKDNKANIEQFYGKENVSSNFMFYKAILSATPKDIKFTMSKKELLRNHALLTFKEIYHIANESGKIYYFENSYLKGFQYGTTKNPVIWVYDKNDAQYQIIVVGNGITQDEIDLIISSISFSNEQ